MAIMAGEVKRSSSVSQELHVLAVDDSYVDRKLIERLLEISSFKVTTVESGTRALQYLGLDGEKSSAGFYDLKVNLIITDYTMPGMTGYELLKKIKGSSAFRKIPVVIMSSEDVLTQSDSCLEQGAEEYIVKPVKLSDVKRLKHHIMRGEGEENDGKKLHKRKLGDDLQPEISSPSSTSQSFPSVDGDLSSSQSSSSPSSASQSFPSVDGDLSSSQSSSSQSSPDSPLKRPKLHNRDRRT